MNLAAPIDVIRMPDTAQAPASFAALVTGLQDAPATVRQGGNLDLLHFFLKPQAGRALLGIPSGEITSRVAHLSEFWGKEAGLLMERLMDARTCAQRFDIIDQAFLRRLSPVSPRRDQEWAWSRLAQTHGSIPIHQLASELGFNRRHFGELFHAEFGVAPKTAARIFRFERACRLMMDERPGLAQVAAACGFHDQAHMTREWNLLAGGSPKTWITSQLPFVQDYEVAGGDDSASGASAIEAAPRGVRHENKSVYQSQL